MNEKLTNENYKTLQETFYFVNGILLIVFKPYCKHLNKKLNSDKHISKVIKNPTVKYQ